jgi:hypothetical protein
MQPKRRIGVQRNRPFSPRRSVIRLVRGQTPGRLKTRLGSLSRPDVVDSDRESRYKSIAILDDEALLATCAEDLWLCPIEARRREGFAARGSAGGLFAGQLLAADRLHPPVVPPGQGTHQPR